MACSLLSEIHKDSNQWTICVLISRKWHYRGGTDEGPIKHTDLVLLDSEGTHMYGQLPPGPAEKLKHVLKEGKVYVIKKFLCTPSRLSYRPVESPFMVQFTRYTVVTEKPDLEDAYPFCTYNLTAFADIPMPGYTPTSFIDVIGRITMVSDVIPIQSMHQTTASNTRTIMLADLKGNELRLVLWGDRAVEFDAEPIRAMGAKEPVIAIFVRTLPKMARGVLGLSGSSACRWYVDEDIPDINSFRASLGQEFVPIIDYVPTGPDALVSRTQEAPIDKTVQELLDLDPFVDMDKRFFCTVTVAKLGSDQRWWFPSCSMCRKSARHTGYQYKCSGDRCSSVHADLTYCVSVVASDGTSEAEFVLFDKVAVGAVGKPLMALLRQRYPGRATVEDVASCARNDTSVPPEINRLVGQKYRLMVCISKKWQTRNSEELSFQVSRIEETYQPELPPHVFAVASGSGASPQLPVLGQFAWAATYTSPGMPQTPPIPVTKLSPVTPAPRSSAHMRGARRTLFATPSKENPQPVLKDVGQVEQAVAETAADNVVVAVEDRDAQTVSLEGADAAVVTDKAQEVIPPRTDDAAVAIGKPDENITPKSKRVPVAVKTAPTSKKTKH